MSDKHNQWSDSGPIKNTLSNIWDSLHKLSVWSQLTGRKGRQEGWRRSLPPWSGPGSSPSGSRVQACSVGAENSPLLHLCYPLILRSTRIKDPLHCLIHITTDFKLSFHYSQHLIPLPWKQAPKVRPVEWEERLWLGSRSSMSNSPERICFHLVPLWWFLLSSCHTVVYTFAKMWS